MSSNTSYIEVAQSILESRELALGPHSVTHVELKGVSGIAYLLNTGGLVSSQLEFLTLFATPPTKDDLSAAVAAAKDHGVTTTSICVAPNEPGDAESNASESGCDVWDPMAFFEHLAALPNDFPTLIRNVAAVQGMNEFSSTFQERDAIIHVAPGRNPRERTVLASYLQNWLSAHKRSPILLLGERGTGKSWQLLQFAFEAYKLNRKNPWQHGLAFFVKLSELVNLAEQASAATPVLPQYVLTKYPDVRFSFGGVGLLGALLRIGHSVVCVDGFDEMDMLPSDSQVRARLTGLLLLLSKSTRFILTCRPGHFTSMSALFAANTWGTRNIQNTFEVLELVPFDRERKLAYIKAAAPDSGRALIERLGGLNDDQKDFSPLQHAVSICAQHPGFLAHMTKTTSEAPKTTLLELIETSITNVFIEFNVVEARTSENYQNAQGNFVDLSVERRMELLSDIAWYMAERQLSSIDLANLPPRIRRWYEIEDDALERDLRSQTVFELVSEEPATRLGGDGNDPEPHNVQWPDSLENSIMADPSATPPRESLARFTLRTDQEEQRDDEETADVGESSVCGGYFLADYIATRMHRIGPFKSLDGEMRLRFLGRVKLGEMTAALLREMLDAYDPTCVAKLAVEGWQLMRRLAADDPFRIYSPWLRYLSTNLASIGALSPAEATALDPWSPEVSSIIAPPFRLPEYDMALVPPPRAAPDGEAFLLGVHEITNEQVRQFLWAPSSKENDDPTVQGREWQVSRMTIAGTGKGGSLSPNSQLSNEYHLFLWMPAHLGAPPENSELTKTTHQTYLPPNEIRRHPATYVSWYAAAAYCDWLSNGGTSTGKRLPRRYRQELNHGLRKTTDPAFLEGREAGYRLPTKTEWTWAARGGHEDIDRPWELFPFYLPKDRRQSTPEQGLESLDRSALENFDRAQNIMRRILVNSAKNQTDVLYDEPNDFGVSGLMGNVREWCNDEATTRAGSYPIEGSERLILGATGYLGDATFAFDYATPLYPRNTNPDVGFRVARSLQQDELRLLQERQAEIATLEEFPKSKP